MLRTAVLLLLAVGLCAGQMPDEGEPGQEEPETMTLFGVRYSVNRAVCLAGVVGAGTAMTFGLPALLAGIGFGPIGVIGGSMAAWVQSAFIGNVAAGSMFAALQSFAMTGGAPSLAAQALITSALACGCLVRVD